MSPGANASAGAEASRRPSALAFDAMPHARLIDGLREAVEQVRGATSREQLCALLDAVVAVTTDLDLRRMLQRIVRSAEDLTAASVCALGVLDSHGAFIEVISTAEESVGARLLATSCPPEGGETSRPGGDRYCLPIHLNDGIFGTLCVSRESLESEPFSAADRQLLAALVSAAGVAIGNARMLASTAQRQRWLEAAAEITSLLVDEDGNMASALQIVAKRAREMLRGDLSFVALREPESGGLRIEFSDGVGAEELTGHMLPDDSVSHLVLASGESMVIEDLAEDHRAYHPPAHMGVPTYGPAVIVPLHSGSAVQGVISVFGLSGAELRFTEADAAMVQAFAGHASLALDRNRAQEERRLLAVLEERDRIARDLHDVVIQRLFGAGLKLQRAAGLSEDPDVVERIEDATDDLDATISDIRTLIYQLHHRYEAEAGLRAQIAMVIKEITASLGFRPRVMVDARIDAVDSGIAADLLAVLREALSNITRHAEAGEVDVRIETGEQLLLTVCDNGLGIAHITPGTGLRTMRERAERHGGTFSVMAAESGGTRVEWQVPTVLTPGSVGAVFPTVGEISMPDTPTGSAGFFLDPIESQKVAP